MQLHTPSCLLRTLAPSDAASLARHGNDRDIWLNLRDRFPHPYTEDAGRSFITHVTEHHPQSIFGIEVDGKAIGVIGLTPSQDIERTSCELGYWIGKKYWGRGIITDAIPAITRHAFKSLGFTRVFAIPFAHNKPSCKVLEKSGYILEGLMRRSAIKDGKVLDQFLYAAYDDTWLKDL